MRLLPQPHQLQMQNGHYRLTYTDRITISASCGKEAYEYAKILAEEIEAQTGMHLMIDRRVSDFRKGIHLYIREEVKARLGKEAYEINVSEECVEIIGGDNAGLLYGVQTIRQIVRQCSTLIPQLHIEDYPELPVRGWFHDATRSRIPKMDFLKEMADRCSMYKINQMHLYVEHTFLFDDFSEIWRDDTPLTAEDILELDAYCQTRNIELVPSVATFGHLYKLLRSRSYRHLSEFEEPKDAPFVFKNRMQHHTLNSTDDESLRVVCKMIDEYSALFTSDLFNINCDETFDLGKGKGKARAEEVGGSHAMYIEWVNKVCDHVKSLGKRPMFWGDIIIGRPETIKQLPEDIICMNWDYCMVPWEGNTKKLWENGATQYLCPGVAGWNQFINLFDVSYSNIKHMAMYAHKYEAAGLLVTDWGDYGHVQYPEFAIIGLIFAGCMGWNSTIAEEEALIEDISHVEFGDPTGKLVSVLYELSGKAVFRWGELVEFQEELLYTVTGKGMERFWADYLPRIQKALNRITAINAKIDHFEEELAALLPAMTPENRKRMLPYFVMADGQKILNRMLPLIEGAYSGTTYEDMADPKELAAAFEAWFYEYKKICWRPVSRESELAQLQDVVCWTADYLRDLA